MTSLSYVTLIMPLVSQLELELLQRTSCSHSAAAPPPHLLLKLWILILQSEQSSGFQQESESFSEGFCGCEQLLSTTSQSSHRSNQRACSGSRFLKSLYKSSAPSDQNFKTTHLKGTRPQAGNRM